MALKIAEIFSGPKGKDDGSLYPASLIDRFLIGVRHLPVPAWFFYLVLLAGLVAVFNSLAWIDGALQFGTFDLYRSSVPFYPVGALALMHHLNRVACRSLAAFRPALGEQDSVYERLAYELVTLPRRGTWITLGLSIMFTAVYINYTPSLVVLFQRSPWLALGESLVYTFAFSMIALFLYHTIWQLHRVRLILATATNINLFHPTPLYAFSSLTAQTGIGLLLMNGFGIVTDPATFENIALITLTGIASLIAVVCFVIPLQGMHNRISAEKKRLRAEVDARLEATVQQLYRHVDLQDLAGADPLNRQLASLVTTREIIEKIPTWPWEPKTLTGFISALLFPLAVRLAIELISRLVL